MGIKYVKFTCLNRLIGLKCALFLGRIKVRGNKITKVINYLFHKQILYTQILLWAFTNMIFYIY